jgi:hypothetical protein
MLVLGGILALLSTIVFAAGLQNDFSSTSSLSGLGLFSSGSSFPYSYTTYLSFGFWLALAGAIVILAASLKKPTETPQTVTPPPPPQEKPIVSPSQTLDHALLEVRTHIWHDFATVERVPDRTPKPETLKKQEVWSTLQGTFSPIETHKLMRSRQHRNSRS